MMNEKFMHAFISKKQPKSAETEQNDKEKKIEKQKLWTVIPINN